MKQVEIDPSEVRRPRQDSPVRTLRLGRPAMLAGLAVIGIGGCAGLAAAAYPTISDMLRPRPTEVHFGRVADMPEIKDGIPALRTTPPPIVRQVAIPPAGAPAIALPSPATPLDPKPSSGTVAPGVAGRSGPVQGASVPGVWSPASDVAATGTAGSSQPIPAAVPKAPETPRPAAVSPREPVKTREAVKPRLAALPRAATPLPPPRAVQAQAPKVTPKPPVREAKAEAVKPIVQKPAAEKPVVRRDKPEAHQRSAAAQPASAPQAEEPTRFLGLPMPDLAPAGRAIKDTVDTVISLPSRL